MVMNEMCSVHAGWSSLVNGLGNGYASASMKAGVGGAVSAPGSPSNTSNPNASTPPFAGYTSYSAPLPANASGSSYARAKGSAGLVYQHATLGANTDIADNLELENRVVIHPGSCASLDMSSTQNSFDLNTGSGSIAVITTGTAGTALWLRGFEYTGDLSQLPPYDPSTGVNAPVEYLKANGAVWKFETVIIGPFNFTANCPLIIPFNLDSKDTKNLIFVSDGAAKGSSPNIPALPDLSGPCSVSVSTVPTAINSCGVTVTGSTTDPLAYNTPGTYIVHWTFDNGSMSANQNVIVTDTTPPMVTLNGSSTMTVECHTSFVDPGATATDACVGALPVSVSGSVNANVVGTYTLTYTATDPSGNQSPGVTRTVQVVDTTPPTITCPGPMTVGGCTGTAVVNFKVTATDTCDPSPIVTCAPASGSVFPVGTTSVNCTATDHAGNGSTCSFNVIVNGLTFAGFQSPLGGTGGNCKQPLLVSNLGNKIPVKFQISCNGSPVTTGTPTMAIYKVDSNCANPSLVTSGAFQVTSAVWHFNWVTASQNQGPGYYHLIATLPDGTKPDAIVQLQ
jgi:hypothetical protein